MPRRGTRPFRLHAYDQCITIGRGCKLDHGQTLSGTRRAPCASNAATDMKSPQTSSASAALLAASDNELAMLAAAGDPRAFEAIMRRHNRLLFRTARSILKSDAETEDAVQEAYLNAWRALGQFRADAKLSTWLV